MIGKDTEKQTKTKTKTKKKKSGRQKLEIAAYSS